MPKMKTKSGAKKRFKQTGSGRFVHKGSGAAKLFTGKKNAERKRRMQGNHLVRPTQQESVERMLCTRDR